MIYHIYPITDLKEHNTDSSYCECDPEAQLQDSGDILIIHNSYDGREGIEMANEILKN